MGEGRSTTRGRSATAYEGEDGVDDEDQPGTTGRDELFEVLSNNRRRYVLHYLKQRDGERVDLSELSTLVTAWEERLAPEEINYADRKSVHTALAQFHLPKMNDAGVVDFHAQRNVVELTEEGDDLTVLLETVEGKEVPWSTYFTSVSLAATTIVVGAQAGLPLVARVAGADLATFVTIVFLLSSLTFLYDSRYRMRIGRDGPPPGPAHGSGNDHDRPHVNWRR
ncbi:hypothetical protein DVK02_11345 [Halobellus sp. Atlit-31R]|nr:hypothetical protein DVK02_11345 [Halobellus sp. Atlit-31R]